MSSALWLDQVRLEPVSDKAPKNSGRKISPGLRDWAPILAFRVAFFCLWTPEISTLAP
jgi:hypothetical protein